MTTDFTAHETALALSCIPTEVNFMPGPAYGDDARYWQGIAGIERSPAGRLWATWYSGGVTEGTENFVLLTTSADDGNTWSPPCLVIDPPGPIRAFDPVLWIDPLRRLWLFWAQAHTHWDGRGGVWAIRTDDPDSATPCWSAPRRLCDGIMMNKPTVLSTGEWLMPASVWHTQYHAYIPCPAEHDLGTRVGSNVMCSTDEGATWTFLGQAHPPHDVAECDEHMIIERRDGSLWMLVRTKYGIGESRSDDRGHTWTPVVPSALEHPTARSFIRRLSTGELLLVKHTVPDHTPARSHLTAHLSVDDGKSWSSGLLLDERNNVSYPDGVEAPDGTIYVIYDYKRYEEKQILLTTFTRDDVIAGTMVSPQSRQRVLVNQAKASLAAEQLAISLNYFKPKPMEAE